MTQPQITAAPPFRIWALDTTFRRDGSPVMGSLGASVRRVIIIEADTWQRMVAAMPALATAQFEVGGIGND